MRKSYGLFVGFFRQQDLSCYDKKMFWDKKIIYLVRHGQSAMNESGKRQGAAGSLSEQGRKQANFVHERLAHSHVDIIITSPYERAKETASIINTHFNKKIIQCDLLKERRNPNEIIGQDANSPLVVEIMDKIDRSYHEGNYRYSDEENFDDLKKRAGEALNFIKNRKEKHILCISHRIFLKLLTAYIETAGTLTSHDFVKLDLFNKVDNASLTVIQYSGFLSWRKKFPWKVLVFNDFGRIE